MSPWRSILLAARPQLIILSVSLLLTLLLTGGCLYLEERAHEELRQQTGQTQALQADLGLRQQESAYLASHIQAFHVLKAQGLLNVPDRENRVEALLATHRELRLPDTLVYALPPARPLLEQPAPPGAPAASEPPPADAPLIHDLDISLRNIHEGELLAFLNTFQERIKERFRVQSCRLNNPGPSGLEAQCTLRFFTLPTPPVTPPVTEKTP